MASRDRAGAAGRARALRLSVPGRAGTVAARLIAPPGPAALYVMAHGAGAGMAHPFLDDLSRRLAGRGVATLRFQFPYMQAGNRRPDPRPVLVAAVRAALDKATRALPGVPIVAGGKSMGGRMTSLLMAEAPHPAVRGLVFLGFPLHPAGKPGSERAAHLAEVAAPMLFLQGTRDPLAELDRIRQVVSGLGERASLRVIAGGDHSFDVLRRSGRTADEVRDELADAISAWIGDRLLGRPGLTP